MQDFAQNRDEIRAFAPELVLRDIPGKSVQRPRQSERFRRSAFFGALLEAARDEVVRVTLPPSFLVLLPQGGLTSRA